MSATSIKEIKKRFKSFPFYQGQTKAMNIFQNHPFTNLKWEWGITGTSDTLFERSMISPYFAIWFFKIAVTFSGLYLIQYFTYGYL